MTTGNAIPLSQTPDKVQNSELPLPSMSQFSIKSNFNRMPETSSYTGSSSSSYQQQPLYQPSFEDFGENGPKMFNNHFSNSQKPSSNSSSQDNFYKEQFSNQQYFQQNGGDFDFPQRAGNSEFSSFPGQQFENSAMGSSNSNTDFPQNSQNFWPGNSWPNTSQSGFSGADAIKLEPDEKREDKVDIKKDSDLPFDWVCSLSIVSTNF